jgi:23S rRNA pseudouridine1911/1915/1917 synthase
LADPRLRKLVEQLNRQFLHAWQLGFIHPASGTGMEFRAALPRELQDIIDHLELKYAPSTPADAASPSSGPLGDA